MDLSTSFRRRLAGSLRGPNRLSHPEDAALATARAIADRLASEMPECQAGIGVAAGQVVAGNVGAHERFEYTVIGEPVNEAARLCELAKSYPSRLLASSQTLRGASENECARWSLGETVTLRGHDQPSGWRRQFNSCRCLLSRPT